MTESSPPAGAGDPSFHSVFTDTLPPLLDRLGISLLVSTYQAGKVVVVRADGAALNTHFRGLPAPMGLAVQGGRLAVGTPGRIWEFCNVPALVQKLVPAGRHDACFVPRSVHYTGDIQVHELAWTGPELWIVNTRFSCLATLDRDSSFVPRWRPPFVSALAPEDRCHLNGLAVRDNRPRYVTALGTTDTAGGWRANKTAGGCLLDVATGGVVLQNLSMPHSPRWYDDNLWLLESGKGTLALVDPRTGQLREIARLPGFTRGLDFCGPYAFIGLSQVRETAVFSGLPITERLNERSCGVWAVDVRTGGTVGFLQFRGGVQEIFSVQVLPGIRFPDLLVDDGDLVRGSFVLPDAALAEVSNPS
jgi:uncharacterized protein (TIGR03032 family)